MNLQLDKTSEVIYEDGEKKEEVIGEIFIRCNNVLFIREDKDLLNISGSGEEDIKMEDGN